MIEQLAQELAGLSVSRIKQIVAKYNKHLKISGHSKLDKEALIGHILQKSNLDRPLMSRLLKETTFHKASSRSRKEPQIDLYKYIGEKLKKQGFPKPKPEPKKEEPKKEIVFPKFKRPAPARDTEPKPSPEPPRPRPAPVQGPRNLQRGFGIQRFETPEPEGELDPEDVYFDYYIDGQRLGLDNDGDVMVDAEDDGDPEDGETFFNMKNTSNLSGRFARIRDIILEDMPNIEQKNPRLAQEIKANLPATQQVASVAPRGSSTIEQATGLTREQFNALDPATAFGRFLPMLAKRNLLGLKVSSEDPGTGALVSKKSSKFTPVGSQKIDIDLSQLYTFKKSRKAAKELALMIFPSITKEEAKKVEFSKFTYDTRIRFGEDGPSVDINIPSTHAEIEGMREDLEEYMKSPSGDYGDYGRGIYESRKKLSAEAGFGYKLDEDKAIEELHRLFPESRDIKTEATDGYHGVGRYTYYGGVDTVGLKDEANDIYYIIRAMPFGYPSKAYKLQYNKDKNEGTYLKKLLTKKNMWGQMKKGYSSPPIDYGA